MPATPYLVVDLDVLEANIARMAERGRELGVDLRPHVKTHKIPQIGRLQLDVGAHGITVATVGEAEVFANAGFDDIFIAYPLWLDAERGARLRTVTEHARVRIGCDSPESAAQAARYLGSAPVEVLVEVDSGQHRSGVAPTEAGTLATAVVEAGLPVAGVFTFPGHSYGTAEGVRSGAARAEADALHNAAAAMRAVGIEPAVRSGGSSPSMAYVSSSTGSTGSTGSTDEFRATEMRPGAYVFNDAQQWELDACTAEEIALTAHATVVSRRASEGRIILDSGSKTLAPDRPVWASGAGRLLDFPDARIVQLSEHHAVVEMNGPHLPQLGETVRVVPNHCCNAINNADVVTVMRGGQAVDTWAVPARGKNS